MVYESPITCAIMVCIHGIDKFTFQLVKFLVVIDFIGFYVYTVSTAPDKDGFPFPFTLYAMLFVFTALSRISSKVLNRSTTSGHLCLFLVLGGKA